MHKRLNCSIHSSKKHRQYESNKVNNTATKHSLCPGNGVCLITLTIPQATQGNHLFSVRNDHDYVTDRKEG